MGITDLTAKVVMEFKGDTSDLKSKLKELSGKEKEMAEAAISHANARNKQLEGWVEGLGKVTLVMGAVGLATKFLFDAHKSSVERARLTTASFGVDMDRVSIATRGLKSEMALLADVAKMNSGAVSMTSDEMAKAEQAMRALTLRGHDAAKAHEEVLKAVTELDVNGLRKMGVALDMTGYKLEYVDERQRLHRDLMKEITKLAEESGKVQLTAGEKFAASVITAKDSWASMAESITEAIDLTKIYIEMIDGQKSLPKGMTHDQLFTAFASGDLAEDGKIGGQITVAEAAKQRARTLREQKAILDKLPQEIQMDGDDVSDVVEGRRKTAAEARRKKYDDLAKMLFDDFLADIKIDGDQITRIRAEMEANDEALYGRESLARYLGNDETTRQLTDLTSKGAALGKSALAGADFSKEDSYLKGLFGDLEEFDAYAKAFDMLGTVATDSVGALIDGSMGAGEAAKKGLQSVLKALALEATTNALKYGALALSYASTPGMQFWVPGALKAAAAWGGVAIAAGVGASQLGSSGSGAGATAPGGGIGASGGGGGGSSQPQVTQQTIVYGTDFTNQSARQRARHAKQLLEEANGPNGVSYG